MVLPDVERACLRVVVVLEERPRPRLRDARQVAEERALPRCCRVRRRVRVRVRDPEVGLFVEPVEQLGPCLRRPGGREPGGDGAPARIGAPERADEHDIDVDRLVERREPARVERSARDGARCESRERRQCGRERKTMASSQGFSPFVWCPEERRVTGGQNARPVLSPGQSTSVGSADRDDPGSAERHRASHPAGPVESLGQQRAGEQHGRHGVQSAEHGDDSGRATGRRVCDEHVRDRVEDADRDDRGDEPGGGPNRCGDPERRGEREERGGRARREDRPRRRLRRTTRRARR